MLLPCQYDWIVHTSVDVDFIVAVQTCLWEGTIISPIEIFNIKIDTLVIKYGVMVIRDR